MLSLNNPIWKTFLSGYNVQYDASAPLKKLIHAKNNQQVKKIWEELWSNLFHQYNVNIASYMAVPQLIRIAKEKGVLDYNSVLFISSVETARHYKVNPPIPKQFENEYLESLRESLTLIDLSKKENPDRSYTVAVLALIAIVRGYGDLADILFEMEDKDITTKFDVFLEQYHI